MKKVLGIITIVLFVFNSQAQEYKFGMDIQPSVTWLSSDDEKITETNGSRLAFGIGAFGEYYFSDQYALKAGLRFNFNAGGSLLHKYGQDTLLLSNYFPESETNYPENPMILGTTKNIDYKLSYLEIPLALKMKTGEFGNISYYAEPGFTLGFRTNANAEIDGESDPFKVSDDIAAMYLSVGLGAGIEYDLGGAKVLVGLSYQGGFTDITKDKTGTVTDETRSALQSIGLRLGIVF